MFKKRVIKGEAPSAKRKLLSDSEDEIGGIIENKAPSSSGSHFKKRSKVPTKILSKEVNHGTTEKEDISKGVEEIGSDKKDENASLEPKVAKSQGAKPAPANIKTLTLTDFQPDVCKDFLQTGYCGYGDTCKFLHVRDELKQTKPVNKEWQTVVSGMAPKTGSDEELLPFKCVLCKKDYKGPVKTQCGHIFCKTCFLDRYKKKLTCFLCSKETNGIIVPVAKKELSRLTGVETS
ncbi:uncharacterized protein CANTADRAFT_49638 [Suhomyces tanzawaensis NRRL Y-17324]|uniref:Pre-mRNA-splicing factor CWC24 n=1 Tax=Suhomyces tanzawaensis NRRL Y-17324 TaxID=984487 RepID=A0A1E4SJJ7_9ASCO|nr:uncharacterized protein CANTADRAFT_49638 [Suhomyces tanzawaensis NRRL Y-17324]ODV79668.1 hypothetical protein CANTADRAFT_49638 [Suhomyces tanzawaensis NRRL Y-17324]